MCIHWRGKATSYLGDCTHPDTYTARVPFNHTCLLHEAMAASPAQAGLQPEDQPRSTTAGPIPVLGSNRTAPQKATGPRRLNP